MRTLTAAMTGHLAGTAHTRCRIALFELQDGTVFGVTDHNEDIVFDLVGAGEVTYSSGTGFEISDIVLNAGLETSNCEISGPIREEGPVTLEGALGGRFNRVRAHIAEVNWKNLAAGSLKLIAGNAGELRVEGGKFVFEIRDDIDGFNQVVGRLITNNCDADFADGVRCQATAVEVVGTVTAVTDEMSFTVSYPGSYANDFFNDGTVEFLTGDLAGTAKVEIFDWTVGGVLTLFTPAVERPAIGDTMTVKQGCPKSRAACMARNAIEWFRGFPEVPGTDQIVRPTIPGQGG